MVGGPTWHKIAAVLSEGKPKTHRQIVKATGLGESAVWSALNYYWKKGLILRTKEPIREYREYFRGRAGIKGNVRSYYLYLLKPQNVDSLSLRGHQFVTYSEKYLDKRGTKGESKSQVVLKFLKKNRGRAWYSKEIAEALKDRGVKPSDVMSTVRRYEKKGLLYVRGYRTHDRQTPFKQGYLITWLDQGKPQEEAIKEAVQRTERALMKNASTSPIIERIHQVRKEIMAATQLKDLVSFTFLQNKMNCSVDEAERAVTRALQLYCDLKEIKLFKNYRYYYHDSMSPEDLKAATILKENYIRKMKGRDARIGHNWEACVEWFIDKFTRGAEFWTQKHRTKGMDPRRITLHLIRSVGDRRRNAEVDRVWEVTPGVFAKPITYVLECKWGLIRKRDVDEFFDVLRWSKEFGVDTEKGRAIKQGVIGVFAGGAFNPREKVHVNGEDISLASYAARMNIQLLKAADFNEKLQERGCEPRVTVQKICRRAKNEDEVKETLEALWNSPNKGREILAELTDKNKALYDFEKMLEETRRSR
jgi:DNA-binding MarR family transcriptional regulator